MKLTIIFTLLLYITPASICGQSQDSVRYQSLDPYYFHLEYLKTDPSIILDVREKFEFRGKRIREAVNVPSKGEMDAVTDSIGKDYSLFLYCTTGYRSKRAAEYLYEKGFRKIYNLDGGLTAWKKDGMPCTRGRIKKAKNKM